MSLSPSGYEYARSLIEASLDPLVTISPDGKITDVNAATEKITGLHRTDLIGTDFSDYFTSPSQARKGYEEVFRAGQVVDYPLELLHTSGSTTPVLYNASVYRDQDGSVIGVFAAARDIHEQVLTREALEAKNAQLVESERLFRLAIDGAPQGIAVVDLDHNFLQVNASLCRLLDRDEDWLLAHRIDDVIYPEDQADDLVAREQLLHADADAITGERRLLKSDGSILWVVHSTGLLRDFHRNPVVFVSHIQDNTAAHLKSLDLTFRATHDSLTGLMNRDQLQERITEALAREPRIGGRPGLLYCDLDGFKAVNDTYGHAIGDEVLRETTKRMTAALRGDDIVTRIGGDEFVVVLTETRDLAAAVAVAEKVRRAVAESLTISTGDIVQITASVGIALASPGVDAHRLLRHADSALYDAKRGGGDKIAIADETVTSPVSIDIRDGLARHQFVSWLQPIVDLDSDDTIGYEALVRWLHADGSIGAPSEFLAVAERTGQITELDFAVLEQAIKLLSLLPDEMHIAVNASAETIGTGSYASRVLAALTRHGVEPHRLHLEFTETALLHVDEHIRATMRELATAGVRWYVDDFGTGYSSISHLRDLPISGLKLDLSFTAGLGEGDLTCDHLAKALVGLAEGLELETVAEGIETPQQAETLRSQGWKSGQGWLYGRPAPGRQLVDKAMASSTSWRGI